MVPILLAWMSLPAAVPPQALPPPCAVWEVLTVETLKVADGHYRFRGSVEITCGSDKFFANEIDLFDHGRRLTAEGDVLFTTPAARISADRVEFDLAARTGVFHNASGSVLTQPAPGRPNATGSVDTHLHFRAGAVEKLGETTYRLSDGAFTACLQPTPRWGFTAGSATVHIDRFVRATHVVFQVKGVPLLYLPVAYYPLREDRRATGFLLPGYSMSTLKGQTVRNGFFWALGRSADLTIDHSYFSKAGQRFGAEFRFVAAPGSEGRVNASVLRETTTAATVESGSATTVKSRTLEVRGALGQQLGRRFRLSASADYTSDISARARQNDAFDTAVNPSSTVNANIAGALGGWQLGVEYARRETLGNTGTSSVSGSAPRVLLSRPEQPAGSLPIYWGVAGEAVGIVQGSRSPTSVSDGNRVRLDLMPSVRMPLSTLPWLQFTPSLAWRATWWSDSRDPVSGLQIEAPVARRYFQMQASVTGPIFARVFDTPALGYAQRWKHVIEPSVSLARTTAVDDDEVYNRIITGYDAGDAVVGPVTRVTYGLAHRLYAKHATGRTARIREAASFTVSQSYYTDPLAAARDEQYRNTFTGDALSSKWSPLVLTLRASPVDGATATIAADYDTQFDAVRQLQASTTWRVNDALDFAGGWSQKRFIPGLAGFDTPGSNDHSLNATATVRCRASGCGGSYRFDYDLLRDGFLNQGITAYYRAQCCGVHAAYQTFTRPTYNGVAGGVRDRQFSLSIVLAGIGSIFDLSFPP